MAPCSTDMSEDPVRVKRKSRWDIGPDGKYAPQISTRIKVEEKAAPHNYKKVP